MPHKRSDNDRQPEATARLSLNLTMNAEEQLTPPPHPLLSEAKPGLSSAEAAERLERYGPNNLPEAKRQTLLHRFVAQFASPLVYILGFALTFDLLSWGLEGFAGAPLESLAIFVILLLNASLGVAQQFRAERALTRLADLSAPRVQVYRDGRLREALSRELVPADVIRLEAGNRIPADAVTLHSRAASADEASVTGESVAVDKAKGDELLAGTLITRGWALAEVSRTGSNSALGQLADMLGGLSVERTPLEKRLDSFSALVARWVLALAGLIVVLGIMVEGLAQFGDIFLFAVALAVAAVPEGLPAVLTLTLALGTERMARRKAVVRRLSAVEALGSVTLIATDKTGTLTQNTMQVRDLDAPDEASALKALVLANESDPENRNTENLGDPVDLALYAYARERGVQPDELSRTLPPVSSRPFDADWQFVRVTVREDAQLMSYLKGAPEALLKRSRLSNADRAAWESKNDAYAAEGYRSIALARGAGEREDELEFLGLVLLWDPVRKEVPDAVSKARASGVRVLMMTGDHPATARSVANEVGIRAGQVLTGDDLDRLSEDALVQTLADTSVLARVKPEHKLRVVEALKHAGEVVAVTGDGVNDAPALKRAHVGVAMGQRGSDVSREVADLVLLDDNFATIVAAIEEGRSIFTNIRAFVRFLFATNLSEVLVVVLGAVAAFLLGWRAADGGLLLPLSAVQILWINLVTDALPALAIAIDRHPAGVRTRPVKPNEPLLDKASLRFSVLGAVLIAAPTLFFWLSPSFGLNPAEASTAAFMTLVLAQLMLTFGARQVGAAPLNNPYLVLAVGFSAVLQVAVLFIPWLRTALALTPLPPGVLAAVGGAAVLVWLLGEGLARLLHIGAASKHTSLRT